MRHKYDTRAIVLARFPAGEANLSLALLTRDLGLVRVRAQGLRKSGAKLASSLATLAECDATLVRGSEGWRLSGAANARNWFSELSREARERASRIATLLLRLVSGEAADERLFDTLAGFFLTLECAPEAEHDAAEIIAALGLLAALGLDEGEVPREAARIAAARGSYIARVNRGIAASGLY